jgi:hypothetical protein
MGVGEGVGILEPEGGEVGRARGSVDDRIEGRHTPELDPKLTIETGAL